MDELAGLLRQERQLLEMLLFKLVEARHLLRAQDARFLSWAAAEVDVAATRLRHAELHRATVTSRLAAELRVDDERLTLGELADASPEPWRTILDDHRQALVRLLAELEQVTADNRELAERGLRAVKDVLTLVRTSDREAVR